MSCGRLVVCKSCLKPINQFNDQDLHICCWFPYKFSIQEIFFNYERSYITITFGFFCEVETNMIMLFKKTSLFSCLCLIAEKNLQHEGKGITYQMTLSVLLFVLFQSSMNSLVLASKLAVSSFLWHKSQLILKSNKKRYTKKTRLVVKLKEYIAIFLHPLVMLLHDVEYGLLKMFVLQL